MLDKHEIKCRVCDRIEFIMDKDEEDFVCGTCCYLEITDRGELQNFLTKLVEERDIGD